MESQIKCLNCEEVYAGSFCPQCSQPSKTARLTTASVSKDFLDAISDSDKGFLRTVIDLSQNPGNMIRDYINGKRKRYLSAGKYTFFLIVLFTLSATYIESHFSWFETLTKQLDTFDVAQTSDNSFTISNKKSSKKLEKQNLKIIKGNDEEKKININFNFLEKRVKKQVSQKDVLRYAKYLIPRYHRTLFDYLKIFIILWIPIFSFFSFLIFYKQKFNFAEHITINSYIYAHILLIFIVFTPFYWVFPKVPGTTAFCSFSAAFFFLIYSYFQFFSKGHYRVLKTSMCLLFSLSTYLITLLTLIIAVAIYLFIINIENL